MKLCRKELTFIMKLVLVIGTASLLSFGVLYLFMDKWVGTDYGTGFQVISGAYRMMNYYIATAVLVQLIVSCIIVFILALHYSHKIAGPMYRLKLVVQRYLNGEDIEKVSFRKTDFLHGVAGNFTDFFDFLRRRKSLLKETHKLLEKADLHDEEKKQDALQRIEKILNELC